MAISDGQKVNATNSNAAWMSRTVDTTTAGKVDLQNTDTPSGSTVTNVQAEINGQNKFVGRTDNSGKDSLPTWTNNNYGTATDDVKTRTDVLDNATKTNENRIDGHDTDIADLQTLSGVAANSTDQGTFTGTTIPDASTTHDSLQSLETAVELRELSANKSQPNGYASLDGTGKVPVSELPDTVLGAVQYQGTWNATTNVPDLPASSPEQGDYYVVAVAGSTSLGGITDWEIGDWAIYNGTAWEKVDNTDQVISVNTKQGVVVLDTDDLLEGTNKYYATSLFDADLATKDTDDLAEGATNKYYSDTLVDGRIALAELGDLSDVNMGTPPNDGEVLTWDNGSSKWIPGVAATAGVSTPKMLGGGTFSWAAAGDGLDFPAPTPTTDLNIAGSNNFAGQKFDNIDAINVTGITIKNLYTNGTPSGAINLKLWDDDTGLEPFTLIGTSTDADASTIGTNNTDTFLFEFASPVSLSASTTYYWTVQFNGGSGDCDIAYDVTESFSGSGFIYSTDGGSLWTFLGCDSGFTLHFAGGELSFDADIELEVPGLNYSDNTIPTSESPISLPNDQDVAYVVLNTSTPGSNLTVTVDTLVNVPDSGAVVVARRDGADVIVGTSSFRLGAGQASTVYPPISYDANRALQSNSSGNIVASSVTTTELGYLSGTTSSIQGQINSISSGSIPPGALFPFAGASAPIGYALCYGQEISRTTYASLFAAIGTTYGVGNGSTTFNLPDLRGRSVSGKDNMGGVAANRLTSGGSGVNGAALGGAGGAQSTALAIANMPAHDHGGGQHTHQVPVYNDSGAWGSYPMGRTPNAGYAGASAATGGMNNTVVIAQGSGSAFSIMQPTLVLNYIIKT